MQNARNIHRSYEEQKVCNVEPFRKEIIRYLEADIDNNDLKVSSIYDILEEPCVKKMGYVDRQIIPYGEQEQLDYSQERLENTSTTQKAFVCYCSKTL
jgi:hypothetical protein